MKPMSGCFFAEKKMKRKENKGRKSGCVRLDEMRLDPIYCMKAIRISFFWCAGDVSRYICKNAKMRLAFGRIVFEGGIRGIWKHACGYGYLYLCGAEEGEIKK